MLHNSPRKKHNMKMASGDLENMMYSSDRVHPPGTGPSKIYLNGVAFPQMQHRTVSLLVTEYEYARVQG